MTPKHFAALAVAAAGSLVAAIAVYSSSVEWSRVTQRGDPLFAGLPNKIDDVAEIVVKQGEKEITLARDGKAWVLKDHKSFPAAPEKVTALLAGLSKARLVEAKTRKQDRYALLGVEDPAAKEAKSRLVRLLDKNGKEVAAVIVGEKRYDAFGVGNSGTYVREPGEEQAWLTDAVIEAGPGLTDWVNPQLFEARKEDVKHLTVRVPGEEPLEIERAKDKSGHTLADIPDGMKLKYGNIVDEIVRAARSFDFDDVRKFQTPPDGAKVSKVVMDLDGGLNVTFRIKPQDDDVDWLSLEAKGEGETKQVADALMTRAKGWEFRIPHSRVKEILKRREDLLEKVSS
jgi:hypothetical protein